MFVIESVKLNGRNGMKAKLATILAASLLTAGFVTASTEKAGAVVYCQYVEYPAGCIVRPGVVLRPRPVARAAAREAVRPGRPMNRGGPVNRVGRY
jgi:hypothetical protein